MTTYQFLLHVILKFYLIVVIISNIYVFITEVLIEGGSTVLMFVCTSFEGGGIKFGFSGGLMRSFLGFVIVRCVFGIASVVVGARFILVFIVICIFILTSYIFPAQHTTPP